MHRPSGSTAPADPSAPPGAPWLRALLSGPRRRALARARRRIGPLVLVAPLLLIVALDAQIRGERLLGLGGKHIASYLGAMLESAAFWGLLLFAASYRRGAIRWVAAPLFVALAGLSIGGQIYFHRQYATYLNLDATLFGTSLSESLFSQLRADGANFLASIAPPIACALALVWIGRRTLRPGGGRRARAARVAAPVALVATFLIPCSYRTVQASTPDVIYFHAVGGLLKELLGGRVTAQILPGLRTPPALPPVVPRATPPRNVLFILTESVRADVACSAWAPSCPGGPRVNDAAPRRFPLTQMRSSASTTAIELAVLWSGLQPTESREDLHSYPLLFDYARSGGLDTAYWTSHHMMFANSRLYVQDLPTSKQCGATELDPLADIDLGGDDRLLSARVQAELPTLKEPFFAVAHFGNTHVPYLVDPADAPFQPALESKAPGDNEAYRNYYRNAAHRQDKAIAELIRSVRSAPFGERTIIVFTSDHGEAFREHGQLGHTGSILEEEIHVPAWIDAPEGTLAPAEEAALGAARDEPVSHTDVTPTILDLMGLWEEPAFAAYRASMPGHSLVRPSPGPAPLTLSNCSGIWGCAYKNWGMMRGHLKLEARAWDKIWHCYDVKADPKEERDLGPAACGDLVERADAIYGGPPGSERGSSWQPGVKKAPARAAAPDPQARSGPGAEGAAARQAAAPSRP